MRRTLTLAVQVPTTVKKFWLISSMLDPRFKKLRFKQDDMMKPAMRTRAIALLSQEFHSRYKGKVAAAQADGDGGAGDGTGGDGDGSSGDDAPAHTTPAAGNVRKKVSSVDFFAETDDEDSPGAADDEEAPHKDELAAYLALEQIENEGEFTPLKWWKENAHRFPNLEVMAREYLGCPSTSATVERLFSAVGLAYADKRQKGEAGTLSDLTFTKMNVD